ncbi:hypothetical protein VDG1235_240 [Verrucomicrobiia bacterium DG1235]|nr:hypothetical protein VDG1235_240 [Verrucomicrobiae bacterium DG1235]
MMSLLKRFGIRIFAFAVSASALVASAHACSVCGTGKEEARVAYWATTAILSFLPLIMIGGVVLFLFKRKK